MKYYIKEDQSEFRKKGKLRQQYTPFLKAQRNPVGGGTKLPKKNNNTKAREVISHDILLTKLNSYGVRDNMTSWFESCLAHRKQVVEITVMVTKAQFREKMFQR
jgi:hypothetical protein